MLEYPMTHHQRHVKVYIPGNPFFFLCVCVWSLYRSLTCLCQCSTPHLAGFEPAFGPAGM